MNIPPYPLAWPDNQRRSKARIKAQFRTGLEGAIKSVRESLSRFAADSGTRMTGIQVTSNTGIFDTKPADPGVSVWFEWDGDLCCIAVDRYLTVADNLRAIHHVLEARRVELRHAGIEMVRTTFRGFLAALPAPDAKAWHTVLGVSPTATPDEVEAAYKALARAAALAKDDSRLRDLNVARDEAAKERAAG